MNETMKNCLPFKTKSNGSIPYNEVKALIQQAIADGRLISGRKKALIRCIIEPNNLSLDSTIEEDRLKALTNRLVKGKLKHISLDIDRFYFFPLTHEHNSLNVVYLSYPIINNIQFVCFFYSSQ